MTLYVPLWIPTDQSVITPFGGKWGSSIFSC